MKREQAIRINDHLLDACKAFDKARMAIAGLAKAERIELEDWLDEVVAALEDELLQPIYDQYIRSYSLRDQIENPSYIPASSPGIRCSYRRE